ncbi:YncE family protein, partial [Halorubrum sp. CBA1125]|uniref:YncE family protein n=1 Tax=Halorubrum sp. CBA1125 TaxID=2668072 RepID=UPI0018D23071
RDAVAAVACEGADALALFALDTGEPLGEIPVGSHPVHATTVRGQTFVATMGDRAVSVVGPDGTVSRIETGVLGPSHFAMADGKLFVSCSAGDVLAVIEPDERTLVDRIGVGAEPHEMAVSANGRWLYAGSRRDGVVDVIEVETRERVAAVDIGAGARVQGVALSPEAERGYAVDQRGERVVAFKTDESTGTVTVPNPGSAVDPDATPIVGTAEVGADPYDLVVADGRVFVPGREDGTVSEFDLDLTLRTVHDGFVRPVDLCRLDERWWVLDAGDARIRSLDGEVISTTAPGLSATTAGDRLVVSHYDDDAVSVVSVTAGTVWTADSPAHPFGSVVV